VWTTALIRFETLFWNRTERRLRAGIRVCIYFGLWGFGPALLHSIVGPSLTLAMGVDLRWLASILLDLSRLVVVLLALWLVARFVDHRPLVAYGLRMDRRWWVDLVFGMALGLLLMTAIFVVEWAAGWVTITGYWSAPAGVPFFVAIWTPVLLFVVVAVAEEVLSRGNQLLNFAEGFRFLGFTVAVFVAWALSSLIFGALHVFNPNSTWLSTLYLVFYGIFLGAGYVFTGQLAIPIGLHITWNFAQGAVFGFPVSGRPLGGASMLSITQSGPTLWTGGAFGPEAGLLGISAALIGIALTILWVRLRTRQLSFAQLQANTFSQQLAEHHRETIA
jgi:uncharacterized protein